MTPLTVFMTLIFLIGQGLKLTISKRGIVGLNLVFIPVLMFLINVVLIFLDRQSVALLALEIDLFSPRG